MLALWPRIQQSLTARILHDEDLSQSNSPEPRSLKTAISSQLNS